MKLQQRFLFLLRLEIYLFLNLQFHKQSVVSITEAENQLSNYHDLKDGQLVIGAGDSFSEYFLTDYIVKFKQLYPGVKIKVINRTSLETRELLKSDQIDIGFLNLPIKDDSLIIKECFQVHDIFVSKNKDEYYYIELGAHNLLLDFARANLGISCVIREFSKNSLNSSELYEIKLKEALPVRSIGYAYPKRRTKSAAANKFIELIEE